MLIEQSNNCSFSKIHIFAPANFHPANQPINNNLPPMPPHLSPEPCSLPHPAARHYHPTLSIWLSVDPMADKYPSTSPYTYCANNPVRLVDPNGREIDDPPYILTIDNSTAILTTPQGSSTQYNLKNKDEYNSLTTNINDILSAGATVMGTAAIAGKESKATFRMTNSAGQLDFRFYANGWRGNQYVTPMELSQLAKGIKIGGNILGGISIGISFFQAIQTNNTSERNWYIADGCAGFLSFAGPWGIAASMYYSLPW